MKLLSILLALATAALATICVVQGRKLAEQRTQLAAAREELEQNSAEIEKLQAAQKHAREQRAALLHQADELAAQLQTRPPAAAEPPTTSPSSPGEVTNAAPEAAGVGKALSKMMQDPEMKKVMRTQQRLMVDQ